MSDKASLRRRVRAVLAVLPETSKSAASATLLGQLQALPAFQQADCIAIFHPTANEPLILPLLSLSGKSFLFPLCHADRSLTWHHPDHLPRWRTSRYGILEPDPALDPAVPAHCMDLVLVPGLAFTPHGDRLGHGAGFYDRFLATLPPGIPTIGVCFECQILPSLPAEPHDVAVSLVLHA